MKPFRGIHNTKYIKPLCIAAVEMERVNAWKCILYQTFIPKMGHSIFAIMTFCVESSLENVTHLLRQSQGH